MASTVHVCALDARTSLVAVCAHPDTSVVLFWAAPGGMPAWYGTRTQEIARELGAASLVLHGSYTRALQTVRTFLPRALPDRPVPPLPPRAPEQPWLVSAHAEVQEALSRLVEAIQAHEPWMDRLTIAFDPQEVRARASWVPMHQRHPGAARFPEEVGKPAPDTTGRIRRP